MITRIGGIAPANSLEVRSRLIEALKLDLVGPRAGHAFAKERLPSWVRPSNWYLREHAYGGKAASRLVRRPIVIANTDRRGIAMSEARGLDGKRAPS
jgi:hypothetical protein